MRVTVDYIFSKNNKIGSKVISWGTDHLTKEATTPSHVAILVNNRWVYESTLFSGVRVISYKKWLKLNRLIAKIPAKGRVKELKKVTAVFKKIRDKKYDWLGVIYFGYRLALNKFLNIKMPEKNKLESEDKYFCTEAVGKFTGKGKYSMKAPVQLLEDMRV